MAGKKGAQLEPLDTYIKKLAEADKLHGNRSLSLVGPYLGRLVKTSHRCNVCGLVWDVQPSNLITRLQGCPGCRKGKPHHSNQFYKKRLESVYGSAISWKLWRTDGILYLEATCTTCGHTWQPNHSNAQGGRTSCEKCSGRWSRSHEDFLQECKDAHGDKFDYGLDTYRQRNLPYTFRCKLHDKIFTSTPARHLKSKSGACPECKTSASGNVISSAHQKLIDLLTKKKIRFETNDRKVLGGKELDLYLPDHKIGIEINGTWFHSTRFRSKGYHVDKLKRAKDIGVQLLQFWDYEIHSKSSIVGSIIQSKLGKTARVGARKLQVVDVSPMLARAWFQEHHLQGPVNSLINLGLADDSGKVLCAMSFSRPRFSKHEWELTRFANAKGVTVVGGASRLFSQFVKRFGPHEVLSYADLRISSGRMYRKLGFTFSHISQPSYFYVGNGKRISRYQAQKHRLPLLLGETFDPAKTEEQNMNDSGYYKVYDCGNLVYVQKIIDMIDQHSFA